MLSSPTPLPMPGMPTGGTPMLPIFYFFFIFPFSIFFFVIPAPHPHRLPSPALSPPNTPVQTVPYIIG